jgi:hypothetical protein
LGYELALAVCVARHPLKLQNTAAQLGPTGFYWCFQWCKLLTPEIPLQAFVSAVFSGVGQTTSFGRVAVLRRYASLH